jgi:hypothetical protein
MSRAVEPLRCRTPLLVAATVLLGGGPAAASDADGSYGRLEGDLALAFEAGVLESFTSEFLCARLTTSYVHTMGVYAGYAESFGLGGGGVARSTVAGLEIRPLFLARFSEDLEQGPAALDLWLDSFALALGLFGAAARPAGCAAGGLDCWSTGIELGLGMELPLLGRADGPFIAARGFGRWPVATARFEPRPMEAVPHAGLSLAIGYRLSADAALVAAGDP